MKTGCLQARVGVAIGEQGFTAGQKYLEIFL